MGFTKGIGKAFEPKVTSQAVNSQATPLANDVLGMLRKQVQGDAMTGFNSLQRGAGTAIEQFVNSGGSQFDFGEGFKSNPFEGLNLDFSAITSPALSTVRDVANPGAIRDVPQGGVNIRDVNGAPQVGSVPMTGTGPFTSTGFRDPGAVRDVGTGDIRIRDVPTSISPVRDVGLNLAPQQANLAQMIADLSTMMGQQTNEQVGDLREAHGIAGTRFGTSLAKGEADLRAKALPALSASIGDLIMRQDTANQNRSALDLQGQQAGVQRDLGVNEALMSLFGLGVNRDLGATGATTDRMDLGVRRDLGTGELGLQTDQARSQENVALRGLASQELMQLLGLNQQGQIANASNALTAQGQGIDRDVAFNNAIAQMLGLGVQRDTAAAGQALDASGQGIQRDLGVQGNELTKSLELSKLLTGMQEAMARFNLDKTSAGQADNLARTNTQLNAQQTQQAQMLQAIQAMASMGNDAFLPILQMAMAGVNPENTVVKDSGIKTIADSLGGILQGVGSIVPG